MKGLKSQMFLLIPAMA